MENRFRISNKSDEQAVIDIDGFIGWDWENEPEDANSKIGFKARLKEVADLKTKKIIVNIDSLGGNLFDGVSIHDILASHPAEIEVNIYGMTASAATIIAMAGDRIRMSDNALLLVHRASMLAMGNLNDMEMAIDDLKKYDNRIANIYAKRTGKPADYHIKQMNKNKGQGEWLTPEDAMEMGYVDEVFEPEARRVAASVNDLKDYKLPIPDNLKEDNNMDEIKKMLEKITNWITGREAENDQKVFNDELQALKGKYEAAMAEQQAQVDDLIAERDTLAGEKTTLTETVSNLEAQVAALQAPPVTAPDTDPEVGDVKVKEHPFDAAARRMSKELSIGG